MKLSKGILLIDDDIDDQEFFIAALQGIQNVASFKVAGNGLEALNILKSRVFVPDIIFSDINMPLMNGIECLVEIVECPHTKNIPVVMLSSDTGRREIVFRLGASAFIEKSANFRKLNAEIAQLITMDFTKRETLQEGSLNENLQQLQLS